MAAPRAAAGGGRLVRYHCMLLRRERDRERERERERERGGRVRETRASECRSEVGTREMAREAKTKCVVNIEAR